jgi:hypothetical protein
VQHGGCFLFAGLKLRDGDPPKGGEHPLILRQKAKVKSKKFLKNNHTLATSCNNRKTHIS